jgi:hypothetical protein
MTEVIRKIVGSDLTGSRQRPDFVMLPDGSVGLSTALTSRFER